MDYRTQFLENGGRQIHANKSSFYIKEVFFKMTKKLPDTTIMLKCWKGLFYSITPIASKGRD